MPYKPAYWVEFEKRSAACVEAASPEEAGQVAEQAAGVKPVKIRVLPYPASPRLGEQSDFPSLCHSPRQCAGHTCCPQNYACSE
jgi:hypothetical protein